MYDNRFIQLSNTGTKIAIWSNFHVVKDRETGVLYIYITNSRADGGITITPMIGADGKPIVEK